jgi:hypothetical protein
LVGSTAEKKSGLGCNRQKKTRQVRQSTSISPGFWGGMVVIDLNVASMVPISHIVVDMIYVTGYKR